MSTEPTSHPDLPVSSEGVGQEEIPFRTLMRAGRVFHQISLIARDRECILAIARAMHSNSAVLRQALERIADETPYRSGYCQTDMAWEPAMSAVEAQQAARAAISQTRSEPST